MPEYKYNIEQYFLPNEREGLKQLLLRLDNYKKNGLKEESWAWGACIEEIKEILKSTEDL